MNRGNEFERQGGQDKGLVIVPLGLLAKIDLHRDTLSRADFVELCIDSLIAPTDDERDETKPLAGPRVAQHRRREDNGVSRAEFEEFKSDVLSWLRTCFEAFRDSLQNPK